ncbi:unnamed protein product [Larinioides sclopetarius]|uniref:Uncharacterized protein n=1 Tax=Larinioides sclopetarius TaxID=280406 RepID=A0AAV1ZWW0_9ARAC
MNSCKMLCAFILLPTLLPQELHRKPGFKGSKHRN